MGTRRAWLGRYGAQAKLCCLKASTGIQVRFMDRKPFDCAKGQSFAANRACDRCTMRDEFASKSFLAVERILAVIGVVMLCSGLVAFAFV
jgi:hypothetical protein